MNKDIEYVQSEDEMRIHGATDEEIIKVKEFWGMISPALIMATSKRVETEWGSKTPLGLYRSIVGIVENKTFEHPIDNDKIVVNFH